MKGSCQNQMYTQKTQATIHSQATDSWNKRSSKIVVIIIIKMYS